MVTDPPHKKTNPQTGLITIHCAAKLSKQRNQVGLSRVKACSSDRVHQFSQLSLLRKAHNGLGPVSQENLHKSA